MNGTERNETPTSCLAAPLIPSKTKPASKHEPVYHLTGGLVDGGLADASGVEHDGGSDVVPFLAGERVDDLLLLALLAALRQTLVLSNCHFFYFFLKKFKKEIWLRKKESDRKFDIDE